MLCRSLMLIAALAATEEALAQDPPAVKTNQANEAAEQPVQRIGSGGIGGGMKKFSAPAPTTGPYGLVDIRHTTNDYYNELGDRVKRDPAVHGKLRIGAKFYGDTVDVSAGVGGAKLPASQRVYQKRPDITVDTYPLKGRSLNILVYANAMFPVRSEDLDPTEYADGDRYDRDYRRSIDATVMSVGLAPNLKTEGVFAIGKTSLTFGADAWTRMYSKPLYIEEDDGSRELGLVAEDTPAVKKPFEDRALRYVHQETVALGYSPAVFPKLQTEIAGYSESRYLPRYEQNKETGAWDYTYEPERISFTRYKISIDITQSATLSNELYYFRNGFFAGDRINDQRRYKNIVRLAFKL